MTTQTHTAPAARPARACRYTVGQAVEVYRCDFSQRPAPLTWMRGVVTEVTPRDAKLWDVQVRVGEGWAPQIVGSRGGNKNIRPAV